MGLKTQTLHFCYLTLVCGPAANSEATWNTTSFWFRICLVCTRVHVCVCVTCRSPYLSWHVQRSEVNIRMSASVASPLFLFRNWGLSLNLESATSARLAGQLASGPNRCHTPELGFRMHVNTRDPNLGTHTCSASTLPTPSHHLLSPQKLHFNIFSWSRCTRPLERYWARLCIRITWGAY